MRAHAPAPGVRSPPLQSPLSRQRWAAGTRRLTTHRPSWQAPCPIANLAGRAVHRLPLVVLAGAGARNAVAALVILQHFWGAPGVDITERIRAAAAPDGAAADPPRAP